MRRVASLTLALVWGVARLAQPLQPECPHHAVAAQAAATATATATTTAEVPAPVSADPHAHHHATAHAGAPAAEPASSPPSHHPAHSSAPCECAAHCCAASTVAMAAAVPQLNATITTPERVAIATIRSSAPRARLSHRQPPATAPPTTVV